MFPREAQFFADQLLRVPDSNRRVLDVGSSTLHYRTVEQPHIETFLMAPLRESGIEVVHVDLKAAEGVDVVHDLDDRLGPPLVEVVGGQFDAALLIATLQNVGDPAFVVNQVTSAIKPGGSLLISAPHRYRRATDPQDSMLRLGVPELVQFVRANADAPFEVTCDLSLRIDERAYYRGLIGRSSWIPVAGRWWVPLPAVSEALRYRIPRLRWRESCVAMRRTC